MFVSDATTPVAPRLLRAPTVRSRTAVMRTLCLVPVVLHSQVREALGGLLLEIVLEPNPARFALLATASRTDLLVIDADTAADVVAMFTQARATVPAPRVAIITGYWSDREPALRQIADAVLFKPPRRQTWHQALARLGVLPLAAA